MLHNYFEHGNHGSKGCSDIAEMNKACNTVKFDNLDEKKMVACYTCFH